jgi:hypothetical protein
MPGGADTRTKASKWAAIPALRPVPSGVARSASGTAHMSPSADADIVRDKDQSARGLLSPFRHAPALREGRALGAGGQLGQGSRPLRPFCVRHSAGSGSQGLHCSLPMALPNVAQRALRPAHGGTRPKVTCHVTRPMGPMIQHAATSNVPEPANDPEGRRLPQGWCNSAGGRRMGLWSSLSRLRALWVHNIPKGLRGFAPWLQKKRSVSPRIFS